ncbi:hypothetical protein P3T43_002597 [Paraburkholderia sp. GAS41]|jgi:hypothetical protein
MQVPHVPQGPLMPLILETLIIRMRSGMLIIIASGGDLT